jgi:copper chaperone CopZ
MVSFQVDGMTCPSGCYTTVRSAIAKQKGVVDVELAPQQKEDVIDNPTVFVKYTGQLDLDATFKAIERVGFEPKKL